MKMPNIYTQTIAFQTNHTPVFFNLALVPGQVTSTPEIALHPVELTYYLHLKNQKRRKEFLAGRLAAKHALMSNVTNFDCSQIHVDIGCFNHPVVIHKELQQAVSISHAEDIAAAISFLPHYPSGIDIEKITEQNQELARLSLTPHEKHLLDAQTTPTNSLALWTAKEALSKILKTGFTVPLEIFEVYSLKNYGKYSYIEFKNFIQYSAFSIHLETHELCLVFPKQLTLHNNINPFETFFEIFHASSTNEDFES